MVNPPLSVFDPARIGSECGGKNLVQCARRVKAGEAPGKRIVCAGRVRMAFSIAFFAGQIQVAHSGDSESNLRLKFLVLLLAASCPEFEPHLGLLLALLLFALAGLQSFDAAGAHVRALLVLGKPDCSLGAALPVD